MSIKVIVELKAAPGRREELKAALQSLLADLGPALKERGAIDSAFYEAVDDPDTLIEIAEWESAAARESVMSDPAAAEALAPLMALLAEPFRATVVQPL